MVRDGDSSWPATAQIGVDEASTCLPRGADEDHLCVHLNYVSRVTEFGVTLPPAPTYFHKPISALNAHKAGVVRPERCKWLNYEGEIAIVIGAVPQRQPGRGGRLHRRLHGGQRLRPARLPRHRQRQHAAGEGQPTPCARWGPAS
jgi:hypothetical protein